MLELSVANLHVATPLSRLLVTGPSGVGKTTALRAVAGFAPGRVIVDGEDLSTLSPQRRRFGWAPQEPLLFPHLNVEDNVRFGGADARGIEMFELQPLLTRGVRHLSGGEKQRVSLARAVAGDVRCLLLDEAFNALDAEAAQRYASRLASLSLPMIIVAHHKFGLEALLQEAHEHILLR